MCVCVCTKRAPRLKILALYKTKTIQKKTEEKVGKKHKQQERKKKKIHLHGGKSVKTVVKRSISSSFRVHDTFIKKRTTTTVQKGNMFIMYTIVVSWFRGSRCFVFISYLFLCKVWSNEMNIHVLGHISDSVWIRWLRSAPNVLISSLLFNALFFFFSLSVFSSAVVVIIFCSFFFFEYALANMNAIISQCCSIYTFICIRVTT